MPCNEQSVCCIHFIRLLASFGRGILIAHTIFRLDAGSDCRPERLSTVAIIQPFSSLPRVESLRKPVKWAERVHRDPIRRVAFPSQVAFFSGGFAPTDTSAECET